MLSGVFVLSGVLLSFVFGDLEASTAVWVSVDVQLCSVVVWLPDVVLFDTLIDTGLNPGEE